MNLLKRILSWICPVCGYDVPDDRHDCPKCGCYEI
jgi:rubrerythrin